MSASRLVVQATQTAVQRAVLRDAVLITRTTTLTTASVCPTVSMRRASTSVH